MREQLQLTEEDGFRALREHVVKMARFARAKHGPAIDGEALLRMLEDPEVVRFPVRIEYSAEPLMPGEFAYAQASPSGPKGGFTLFVHPAFEDRPEVLPHLAAYHIPAINYLDVATRVEAELFGAHLLGLDVDNYYARLCALADELPGNGAPELTPEVAELLEPTSAPLSFAGAASSAGGPGVDGSCGTGCGCAGGSA